LQARISARHRKAIRSLLVVAAIVVGQLPALAPQPAYAASNYSSVVLSDTPSAYWRLGETTGTSAADATGHGNALTYQGGFTLGIPGAVKGDPDAAVGFNGTTAVATQAKSPLTAVANWTLEAWVYPITLPQLGIIAYNGIKDTSQGGYGFAIGTASFTSGSKLIGILGSATTIDSGYSFAAPNQWYHVVMTRDTSTIRFYVNGKQTTTTSTAAPTAPGARSSIGAGVTLAAAAVNGLTGAVDEAAVYPTALSTGRISAHYQEGASATSGFGNWATQSPTGPPSVRYEPAMGWDAGHSKVVLFGGQSSAGAAIQDTWTWNGTAWTKLTPATQPSARWGAKLVYDTALNKMVLFGGYTGSTALSDTWTWDGTTWASVSPGTVPPARYEYGLAYDKTNSVVVMFGGFTKTTYLQDTYTFNGTNWTLKAPAAKPTIRARMAMAYQDSNNKTVMFGGVNGTTYNAETWLWDGTNWTQQTPNSAPSARANSGLAYDPTTLTAVLIGGVNGTSYFGDTWTWDGANWSLQHSSVSPSVRAGAGFAYNGVTFNGALFGGLSGSTYLGDTLAWNTPPAAPTALTATPGNTQATISWTAPANGGQALTGYKIVPYVGTTAGSPTAVGGSSTSATITGLVNGTAYTFTVAASNTTGTGPVATSNAVTPATVPGAPTGVSGVRGNAQVAVSWTAPASNGGSAITGYTVTSAPGGFTAGAGGSATTATVTGLTNGTAYTFTVTATNAIGIGPASSPSSAVTPATVPGAPTGVSATAGNAQATVSWTAPAANGGSAITGYTVTSSPGGVLGTAGGSATSATVSPLTNGTSYTFTVTATNSVGTGPASSPPSNAVTPSTVPGAPTNVTATAGNAQASVSWTPPASNGGSSITGYTVTSSPGGFTANAGGSATTATVTGLTNGTAYTFTVTATTAIGTGPASSPSPAVTPATVPGAPTGVTATGGNAQATVTWTAPASNGGAAITGYTATSSPGGFTASVGGGATSATVVGLTNGTSYTFTVTATNSVGTGPASSLSNAVTPAAVPGAPTGVTATAGNAQAAVSWTAPPANGSSITSYTVTPFVGSNAGSSASVSGTTTSTTLTGLLNGTTYTFQVTATNGVGTGLAGTSSAVTPTGPPYAPTNVVATGGNAQATVTWTAPGNGGSAITGYTVTPFVGSNAGTPVGAAANATSATVTGLSNGTTYTFQVTATSALGIGAAGTSNAVTPATVPQPPGSVSATGGDTQATVTWTAPANGGSAITGYIVTPYVGTTAGTPVNAGASATSTTVTGLINGTIYTFQVDATNALGNSAPGTSNPVTVGTPPGPPTNVTAVSGNTQATVSWTAPTNTGGLTISGYTVTPYIGTTAGTPVPVGGSTTTTTVTGLNNGVTYTFQVTATNALGTGAAGTSNAVTPATVPQAPGSVTASAGNAQAIVSWTAPSNGGSAITGYTVTPYIGSTAGTPVNAGASATGSTVTGLVNGTTYTFQVVATNGAGNSAPGTSNAVTPGTPPGPPTNVTAASGNAQAAVNWTAPTNTGGLTITGYTVTPYVGTTPGTAVTVGGGTLTATVTGLTNGTAYTFQVYATNAMGNSSAVASGAVVVGSPAAPTGVAATAGANQATVNWTAPASNGGAISGYVVQAYAGSQAQNSIAVAGSVVTATLSGLQGGVAYTFQVTAANSFGGGPPSSATAAVTPTGSASTYASTVLGNTPSLYYRLGDPSGTVAADSSGTGIPGTYNGNVTLGGAGVVLGDSDHAVALDGGSAYISAPTNQALQGDNTRTVELWFKTTSTNQQPLFDSGTAGAGTGFVIALTQQDGVGFGPPQNTPGIYVAFGSADIYLPGLSLTDGNPHYLAVTLSGTTVYVYVDGQRVQGTVLSGSTWSAMSGQPFTLPATPNTAANPIWIGRTRNAVWGNGSTFFNGTIDEAAVYQLALSGAQVSAHVQAAGYLLAPATNVVATAGANQATVTWTAPTTASSATTMLVTAYLGAQPVNAVGLAPTATSVTISGLQGGSAYTFTVVTSNGFGPSPTATSNAVTPTGNASTYASTVLSDSPSIYYRLGDPSGALAVDSSGNGRNANYQNTPYTLAVGGALVGDSDPAVTIQPNCCYYGTQFGGSEVQYRLAAGLPSGNSARSIEVWVKTTNTGTQGLVGWGNTGSLQAFQLTLLNGNQISVTSGANDTPLVFTSASTIANGNWHLITVSYNGTTLTVYLDGQSMGTGTFSAALTTSSSTTYGLILGHYFWCGVGCNQYNGSLDEVAIYGAALSSAQVAAHFNASGNSQPTAASGITATAGANQATVSWTAATASAGSPVIGYVVSASLNGTQSQNAIGVGGGTTSTTISGLQGGAAYTFTVTAYNNYGYGPASAASASVTPSGSASTYASTVLGDTPSIYYRLDDPSAALAVDSSGSGRSANYQSTPYTLAVGGALVGDSDPAVTILPNCCYYGTQFGGSEVQYKLTAGLPSGNAARSIEVWIKTTNTSIQGLVGWGNTGGLQAFQLAMLNGNQVSVTSGANDTPLTFTSTYTIANGSWHLITATYDGTTLTVYLDGQSLGTGTFSGALATSPNTTYGLILGHYFWCGVGCNEYNGSLDDAAIYGAALNPLQVAAHFNASGNSRPTAGSGVSATAGANQATVSWTASTASTGSPVSGYLVTASLNGTQSQNAIGVGGATTSTTVTGLQGGAAYTFTVAAYNNFGYGTISAASASITTTGTASSYASTVLGDTPSMYYRLGDPSGTLAADSSGNGRNAYYQSTPYTLAVAGALVGDNDPAVTIQSGCCYFGQPTGGSEVQYKLTAGLPSGNASRSVEVWVKTTNTGTQGLVGWGTASGHEVFQLRLVSGNQIQLVSSGDDPSFTAGYTIANGSWHLITVTYDGTTLTGYLDGQSLGTTTFSGALSTVLSTNGLILGHDVWCGVGCNQYNGSLDEVAIYGAALSSAQVAAHFNASANSRPTAASGVSATAGANQATVNWTASTASAGSPVSGYVVTASLNGTQSQSAIGVGAGTTTIITGLQGGTAYTFTVTPYNNFGYGPVSTPSASVTTTGIASTYASTVLAAVPSIYYRLGDPSGTLAADSSGNGRNANYQSTPYTLGVSGALVGDADPAVTIQSGCCYFGQPTGGSEVQYKLAAGLPSGNAARSIEVWVKTTNTGTQGLVGWGTTTTHEVFQLRLVGGNQIQLVTWGDDRNFTAASSIADGFWHHIVVTYDGTTLSVYLDGQNIGTTTFSGALATTFNANGLILGHDVWGGVGSDQFNGSLDEVAIYSSVLTPAQITAHYTASGATQNFPGAPTGVSATGGVNQATVTWTAPSSSGGSSITGYTVVPHVGTTLRTPVTVSSTTTSTVVSGLSGGTIYSFTVNAANATGTGLDSAASNLVTPTGTVYPYSATVLSDAPAGYWRLGEATGTSATDSSGNGNTGTYLGASGLSQSGAIRNDPDPAVLLDGITSYVSVRSSATLNVTGALSLEAWVNFSSTAGTQQIVNKGDGAFGSGTAYELSYISGTGVVFDTYLSGGGSARATWRVTPQTGVWYYLVGIRTADGALALYANGMLMGTANDGGSSLNNINATVGLGSSGVGIGSNREPLAGNLDEVAIYPSALSAAQIALHWQASANRPGAPTNVAGTASAANQITVTWTAPTDSGSTAISGYVVTPHVGATLATPTITAGTATTATVGVLSAGTAYTFTVSATNLSGVGAPSAPSSVVTATGTTTYPYASTVLADVPIAYWRLGESSGTAATDLSGNGNGGTYVAGDTLAQAGPLQRDAVTSTKLDGVGGQVLVPNAAGLNITGDVTAEAWVKFNSITANQVLISKGEGTTSALSSYQLSYAAGNGFVFTTFIGTTATAATYPMTPVVGTWYHVAGARTAAGQINVWVDCRIGSGAATDTGAALNSTGSALGIGSAGSGTTSHLYPLNGFIEEAAVYNVALSQDRICAHWQAGGYVPSAPMNVTAVAGVNSAKVSWTAAIQGVGPVTSYTITPKLDTGASLAPLSVTSSTTSTNIPALPSGASMSFAVTATNSYGTSGAGTSPAVSILGNLAAPGMDRFLAIGTGGNPARGIYYEGWKSDAQIPATSLGQWTVEGWIWDVTTKNTTTGNMAWGLLNATTYRNPQQVLVTIPSSDVPQAGINWNVGILHGIGSCCDVSFVWPHNGNTSFGTNGQYTPTNNLGAILSSNTPVYVALDYDGTNVRGYINGALIFTAADSAAIPADAWAGFFDESELAQGAFDGFRVSSVARYTSSSFSVPTADTTADASTLVDYNFDNYSVGKQPSMLLTPFYPWTPITAGSWPDSSSHHNPASFMGVTNPWEIGWFADSAFFVQPFEMTPGIAPGQLADECNGVNTGNGDFCHRATDMSIPGRGASLSLTRTYNSFADSNLGSFGYGWASSYGAHLVIDGGGNVILYDPLGGNSYFPNQNGSFATSSYVSTGLTFSGGNYTLTDKHGGKLVFNSSGQLIQETDRNGYVTTLAYIGANLSTVTEPAGRQLTFSYGTNGLVSSVTDGTRTVLYHYEDGNLNLTSVTDVLGGITTFTYDSAHRMLTDKGPVCNLTTGCNGLVNVYDTNGRVSKQTDPVGSVATYSYTTAWPLFTTTVTDPFGHQNKYEYALGLPLDVVQAADTSLAATTTYTYDPASLGVASVTNPNSETTTATYDTKTNPLTSTDALGNTTTYTYNSLSEPLTVQDPMGITTTNSYDANGNLLSTSIPLVGTGTSQVVTYTYGDPNHLGDLTAKTDPTNRTIAYIYDSYGDLISSTDPLGNKTTYVFDSLGRMTSTVSPLGNVTGGNAAAYTTTYTYNAVRQPLTVTDPLNHQALKQYDIGGHLILGTDANGNVSSFSYDLDGRLTASTAGYGTPQATTNQTSYDAGGRVATQTDGLNHTLVTYTYDVLSRQATSIDGMTRTTTYNHDTANRLISSVNPLNQTTTYAYNSGGQLTGASYSDGLTASVSYSYDPDGLILTMVDGTGTTTNVWDSLHRLVRQTDGAGHTVGYTYDLAGRLTSIAYPGGSCTTVPTSFCVTRLYDTAGRLASVQDWLSHTTTFVYDANSNMTGIAYPNGVLATATYNTADQLTNISDVSGASTVLSFTYTRDNNAQVTGDSSASYGYNSLNQLTTGPGLGFVYDPAGRLTQTVNGPVTTNYSYDNADQLNSTAIVGGATTNYGFDAVGRRITVGSTSLTWNQQNRLLTYGSGSSYTYNGVGLRVSKTVAGQTESFVWDTVDALPIVLQDGSISYVTGPGGLPLEQVTGSTVYYYQHDQLGSTRALTDSAGAVVASYNYDAYGNLTSQTGSVTNPFLFTGQYRDSESGMYHLRARYYDPGTGQFISRDPKLSSTWAPYSYVADNPLNGTDASGLDPLSDLGNWVGDQISNAYNAASNWVAEQYNNFAAYVSVVCPPAGSFLYGLAAGYNFNLTESSNPFFVLGEAVGIGLNVALLLTGPEDPLADADAVRLATLAPKAAELATDGAKVVPAAERAAGGVRVLGSYPQYVDTARAIGGKAFSVPQRIWEAMSPEQQWAANQRFLDRGIAAGDSFLVVTGPRMGAGTVREINYLRSQGYEWTSNGLGLVPKP
jgi:RHS repeat-associated protein